MAFTKTHLYDHSHGAVSQKTQLKLIPKDQLLSHFLSGFVKTQTIMVSKRIKSSTNMDFPKSTKSMNSGSKRRYPFRPLMVHVTQHP